MCGSARCKVAALAKAPAVPRTTFEQAAEGDRVASELIAVKPVPFARKPHSNSVQALIYTIDDAGF